MGRVGLTAMALAVSMLSSAAMAQIRIGDPDPARVELAHKLVELSGGRAQFEAQITALSQGMKAGLAKAMPAQSQFSSELYDAINHEMVGMAPDLLDFAVGVYARNLSEDELRALIDFQSSPTGQSILHKMPAIQRDVAVGMVPIIMTRMPTIMRTVVDHVCETRHCTAQQHDSMVAALTSALNPPAAKAGS